MRLVCEFSGGPARRRSSGRVRIGFDDTSHPGRIGWHEVVVTGSGVTLSSRGSLPATSISNRLRTYPPNLIPHPLDVQNVTFPAALGGRVDAVPAAARCRWPLDRDAERRRAGRVAGGMTSPDPGATGRRRRGAPASPARPGSAPPAPPGHCRRRARAASSAWRSAA